MPILHAIVLGITQGLSEFLPISSSGHLALVPWLFGWDDFGDDESLAKTFDVALHMGTLVGALAFFRSDVLRYIRAGFGLIGAGRGAAGAAGTQDPARRDGVIAWLILATAVPAAITGVLFEEVINELDDVYWLIGVMLVVMGLVLLVADRLGGERELDQFRLRDALIVGAAQAVALQPGVSRSGVTITTSRWLGFDRASAARISFLMSLPITAGAGLFKGLDVLSEGGIAEELRLPFVAGMVASGITGYAAVWGTIRFVQTRTFTPFVFYRVLLGVGVIALVVAGFRA